MVPELVHRAVYVARGVGPTVRVLGKTSGVSIDQLYALFPGAPGMVAARIAGLPEPRGPVR